MMSKKVYIFAHVKKQYKYFQQVNSFLQQDKKYVIYHKELRRFSLVKIPFIDLKHILDNNIMKRKYNLAKYRNKGKLYMNAYRFILYIKMILAYSKYSYIFNTLDIQNVIIWNGFGMYQNVFSIIAKTRNINVLYMENGLTQNHTVIDKQGVNYFNSVPRVSTFFLKQNNTTLPKIQDKDCKLDKKYIFVPFQVNTDSQIICFSPWVPNMYELFEIITKALEYLPKEYSIIMKTHPMCLENYDTLIKDNINPRISFATINNNTEELIKNASAICTINSTVGIEALMQYKKVITLGQAFYNIDNLTTHANNQKTLNQIFSNIETLKIDTRLIANFISYLDNDYQVFGDWRNPDTKHFTTLKEKINLLLA